MNAQHTLAELLRWVGGRWVNADRLPSVKAEGVAFSKASVLGEAPGDSVAFFFSRHYEAQLATSNAAIVITGEAFVAPLLASKLPLVSRAALVACADPYRAMAIVSEKLATTLRPTSLIPDPSPEPSVIHPTSVVHPQAVIEPGCEIGPLCVIEAHARVGSGSRLVAQVYVGARSEIGKSVRIFPGVTIYDGCFIGDRTRIHSGCIIGADGFGYAPERRSDGGVTHHKIHHLGGVRIGNDVEIGANTCIDRGTVGDTIVGAFVKIDNGVQIAHNCHVDEGAVLCGHVGLTGSASVGKYAYLGGRVGVANQVHVGDGAQIAGMSMVTKDVPAGAKWSGMPAREEREYLRQQVLLSRILRERDQAKGRGKNE